MRKRGATLEPLEASVRAHTQLTRLSAGCIAPEALEALSWDVKPKRPTRGRGYLDKRLVTMVAPAPQDKVSR